MLNGEKVSEEDVELNPAFKAASENKKRYRILYGGAGSGKSYFVAQEIIINMMSCGDYDYLVVRKVSRTLRHSVFKLLQTIISDHNLGDYFTVNKTEMSMICATGSTLTSSGLDDVEKLKSIANINSIWIEEASEVDESDFHQLDLRLRGNSKIRKQITLTFNPVSSQSWLKKYFFDQLIENAFILKTTYKDNEFIDPEYKKVIESLKDKDYTYYQIYGLGDWGTIGNLIYNNYEVIFELPDSFDEVINGLDFGFVNPSALTTIGLKDESVYIMKEFYKTKLTNSDLIGELKTRVNYTDDLYADSAEPARIEEIGREGFNIYPADKSVKDGIDFVKRHRLYIYYECVEFISEIGTYKYKEDRNGVVTEEPVKFKDHLMDSMRYALYTHSKNVGRYAGVKRS
jgi:phage terminase large subunit